MRKFYFRYIVFIVFAILFVRCTGNGEMKYQDCLVFSWKSLGNEILLHGNELNLDEHITRPMRLFIKDSTLFLLNNNTEGMLQLIDLNTEKQIGIYGSFGSGPADMMTPRYIQKKDSVLFIYDSRLLRFNQFTLNSDNILNLKNSIQFASSFEDLIMLSDSILVASVLDPRLKKMSYFKKDSMIKTVGDYPQVEGTDTPLSGIARLEGFSSSMAWNPLKQKIAIAYKQTDLIEIYDNVGRLENRIQGPDVFFPSKSIKSIGNTQKVVANIGEEKDAYFSPVATENELFVLYSGLIYQPGEKGYLLNHLFVFDWNGKPLRRYKLDIPIFRFTINESGNKIYGITDSPEFRIIQYNLD